MTLINREIVKLVEDVEVGCGMADRRFTEPYDDSDNSKLEVIGYPGPGSSVVISWKELDDDDGYVFTLPGFDSGDIYMSGIIHIPKPGGCEKCDCDSEWIYLGRLLANPLVVKVKINAK